MTPEQLTQAYAVDAAIQAENARRAAYKVRRYFHDCPPSCRNPHSRLVTDHVSIAPDQGPTCRILYRKSLLFFRAGLTYAERGYIAANRIGKTETACYEVRCHMTGQYPAWWPGRKWERPTEWRAAGDTMLTTRDVSQKALLGHHEGVPLGQFTGMIDPHRILNYTRKSGGVNNCIDTIWVRWGDDKEHGAPMVSRLSFLSYDMGRRVFQGFECDGIWIDEEPPDPAEKSEAQAAGSSDIYGECLLRTMTLNGIVLATFTPLRGMTPFLSHYLATAMMPGTEDDEQDVPAKAHFSGGTATTEDAENPDAVDESAYDIAADQIQGEIVGDNPYGNVRSRFVIGATWDDAPHLTEQVKAQQWAGMLPYQRAARTRGIPQLGAGAIYPIDEADLKVDDFPIPDHWLRGFSMDCGGGAKPTAAGFYALNPDDRVLYLTTCYKRASNEPSLHAAAIKERMMKPTGWLWTGVGDAAALIMTDKDAEQLVRLYQRLGLDLHLPDKAVETGIADVWDLMTTGRFKVFARAGQAWFEEFRMYRRDKHGRIVKSNDHLMDQTRYMVRSGIQLMKRKPVKDTRPKTLTVDQGSMGLGWMGS